MRVCRCAFFANIEDLEALSIMDRVHQMMGNLFYRRVAPSEIKSMGYKEMKYWNDWHELMAKEETRTL